MGGGGSAGSASTPRLALILGSEQWVGEEPQGFGLGWRVVRMWGGACAPLGCVGMPGPEGLSAGSQTPKDAIHILLCFPVSLRDDI